MVIESETQEKQPDLKAIFSLANIATVLSLLVAILGPLYVLGMLALWVELSENYTYDFTVAWYAASLIPKAVVLGHSAILLWEELPYFILLLFLHTRNTRHFRVSVTPESDRAMRVKQRRGGRLRLLIKGSVITVLAILFFISLLNSRWTWSRFVSLGAGSISGLVSVLILWEGGPRNRPSLTRYLASLTVLYIGVIFITIFDAGLRKPPLPAIHLRYEESDAVITPISGKLLSHSEGHWYVLAESEGNVLAIPDGSAKGVTISSRGRAAPQVSR